eukprot:265268-Chlamydomonas_euryale.AAC.4
MKQPIIQVIHSGVGMNRRSRVCCACVGASDLRVWGMWFAVRVSVLRGLGFRVCGLLCACWGPVSARVVLPPCRGVHGKAAGSSRRGAGRELVNPACCMGQTGAAESRC